MGLSPGRERSGGDQLRQPPLSAPLKSKEIQLLNVSAGNLFPMMVVALLLPLGNLPYLVELARKIHQPSGFGFASSSSLANTTELARPDIDVR